MGDRYFHPLPVINKAVLASTAFVVSLTGSLLMSYNKGLYSEKAFRSNVAYSGTTVGVFIQAFYLIFAGLGLSIFGTDHFTVVVGSYMAIAGFVVYSIIIVGLWWVRDAYRKAGEW